MQATAEQVDVQTEDLALLKTILDHPDSKLAEIADFSSMLAHKTYDAVMELHRKGLLSVREDNGARRYSITDAGRQVLGVPTDNERSLADELHREEERIEKSHSSALKQTQPLAEFPHSLKEPEQRELVLQAIREKYGTLDGIKRRVGFPLWFDMTELLAGMTVDYLIRRETKGDLTAFFLYEDKPLRFWRIGDGRIDFEKDPNFMPRDEEAKAEELSGKGSWVQYPDKKQTAAVAPSIDDVDDFDPDDDLDEPITKPESSFADIAAQNGASNEVAKDATSKSRRAYKRVKLDAAAVEKATAETTTLGEICERLGISNSALYKKMDQDPGLKAAYKRGLSMRDTDEVAPGKKIGRPMKSEPTATPTSRGTGPDLDVEEVERIAQSGMTAREAAAHFGMTYFVFRNRLNAKKGPMKPIRDAWYRGRKNSQGAKAQKPAKPLARKRTETIEITGKPLRTAEILQVAERVADDIADAAGGTSSLVDHPAHYNRHPSGIECIDVIEHMSFNLGNAIKYIWRADEKGSPATDLEKAIWYLQREQARRQKVSAIAA